DLYGRLALDRLDLRPGHQAKLLAPGLDEVVVAAVAPDEVERRREAIGNPELAAARSNQLLRLGDLVFGGLRRPLPAGVVVERELAPHLVLEVGDQLRRSLLGRRLQHLFALAD